MKYGCRAKPPPVIENIVNITSFAALQPSQFLRQNVFTNWLSRLRPFDFFLHVDMLGSTVPTLSFSPRSLDTSNLETPVDLLRRSGVFLLILLSRRSKLLLLSLGLSIGIISRQKQKEDHCVEEPRDIPIEHIWVIPLKFICDVPIVCQNI